MATTIKLKNSVTTTAAPASLVQGEVATNITDKKLWVGNAASSPVQLIGTGASVSFTTITTANDASISGLTVGKGGGAVASNTALGFNALQSNSTGTGLTSAGVAALQQNTTGSSNTAVGAYDVPNSRIAPLYSNTTGSLNTGVGVSALGSNTTGSSNTAIGVQALIFNTTASNNTAVGYQAGYSNVTGAANTYVGSYAGLNSTGGGNTIVGNNAGSAASFSGAGNVLVGVGAGVAMTTGASNTFVGGGIYGVSNGAGAAVTTGSKNSILGNYSGNQGGLDIRTASNYIVLSDGDGNPRQVIDGSGYVAFGTASTTPTGANNSIILRPGLASYFSLASNNCVSFNRYSTSGIVVNIDYAGATVGNISTNGSNCTFNSTSDYRLKEDIAPMIGALAKVQALKPVTYKWKETQQAGEGFIAHELAEVCPEAVTGKKDEVDENGKAKYQSIDQSFLIATLTAAIQELNAKVTALETQLQGK